MRVPIIFDSRFIYINFVGCHDFNYILPFIEWIYFSVNFEFLVVILEQDPLSIEIIAEMQDIKKVTVIVSFSVNNLFSLAQSCKNGVW